MGLVLADRCKETTTTTGTGTISLGGAQGGYRTIVSGVGTGNTTDYCIADQAGGPNWEVGTGTITSGTPDTLTRTTVWASSNAGALVNFGTGTKDVFVLRRAGGVPTFIAKPADEGRASNTTLTADTDLQIALSAGKMYAVTLVAYFGPASSAANGGFKYDFNFTGTTNGVMVSSYMIAPTATAFSNIATDTTLNNVRTATWSGASSGTLIATAQVNVNAAGTFSLRWAQNTSSTNASNVWGASYIQYKAAT